MSPSRPIPRRPWPHERGGTHCAVFAPLIAAMLTIAMPAAAVERIRLRAAQITVADASTQQLDAQWAIESTTHSTLTVHTGRVTLPASIASKVDAQVGALNSLSLQCRDVLIRTPLLACPALRATLRTTRWSELPITARLDFDTERMMLQARGDGPPMAGVAPHFEFNGTAEQWRASAKLPATQIEAWLPLLHPWLTLPPDFKLSGKADVSLQATGHGTDISTESQVTLSEVEFQNSTFTWIGEKLALSAHVKAVLGKPLTFDMQVGGEHGQLLTGPVLLDFDRNPLQMTLRGSLSPQALRIDALDSQQKNLAHIAGTAEISLSPLAIKIAQVDASEILFPAAYSSFLQLSLATTPFNQIVTRGNAAAHVSVVNNEPTALTLSIGDLALSDAARSLDVSGVNAEVHWGSHAQPELPSWLTWDNARGWGLTGAKSRLDFAMHDRDFRLLQPARLPLFDGALRINTLAVRKLGLPDMAGDFDAVIDPISVGPIAKALGWPEFSGTLSGRIPGLTYRNRELTLQGDVDAQVFDGHVTARNLRVRDPLADWPRLYADITARNLDLDLITRTFEFGSITGRLDVDVTGLETFGMSPVAFDLKVGTPSQDRSPHRISQRAVQNLSKIGGGGTAAALQSSLLRFFEQFGYSRLGFACRLRNDACQMSGIDSAPDGFFIMKGSGIPKLDIIGHNQRVEWLTFLGQVRNALANPENINVGRP